MAGSAAQRRTLALLVLIAAAQQRGVTRDQLVGRLWPDATEERARHSLAQTLYRIRQQFGADFVEGTDVMRLNAELMTYDVSDFEAAARQDERAAAALYTGPFLDGFVLGGAPEFERWAEEERSRLAGIYWQVLERLAEKATAAGEPARAAEWWRARATAEPLNSRVATKLVHALRAAGESSAALKYARVHETLIRQELDSGPSP